MVGIIVFVGIVLVAIEISDRIRHDRENAVLLAVNRDLMKRQHQPLQDGDSNP
jgi:hypothetical protein